MEKILVIGSNGQLGTELVEELRKINGVEKVIASDVKRNESLKNEPFEELDVLDAGKLLEIIKKHGISQIYLLAALLSATAEKHIKLAWKLNMEGLLNVLDLAREKHISKIYWPSSIAVFGPTTPRQNTPQQTIMEPNTVYGISKLAGERWCEYYFRKFGVDVRSLRYPGLIGHKSAPGGGTTDYAVHIYHEALKKGSYECFLSENTTLPMMYMPDAIKATLDLMAADSGSVKVRSSYNVAGMSFSPAQISKEIQKHVAGFKISYKPDSRQEIANSWPESIDDSVARADWNWKPYYNLEKMTDDMFFSLKNVVKV
jgi:nucleoside-diphosphate-sugar epimerase